MTTTEIRIEQAMLDATGEPVERALQQSDIDGLIFLELCGGKFAIYNPHFRQALKRRFDSLEQARIFAIWPATSKP